MVAFLSLLLHVVVSPFKTRARLEAEIIMLRHQLNVLRRRFPSNPKLVVVDRLLFVWLYRLFPSVLNAVTIVQPETIVGWHRTGFRLYWRWKSRSRGGRPRIPGEIRRLIRENRDDSPWRTTDTPTAPKPSLTLSSSSSSLPSLIMPRDLVPWIGFWPAMTMMTAITMKSDLTVSGRRVRATKRISGSSDPIDPQL